MGYNTNPELVEERLHLFGELVAGRACRWQTTPTPGITKRLEYKIRETLYIASLYPDRFPELARAYRNFAISVVEPGVIEAKPKEVVETFTPVHGIGPAGRPVPTVRVSTAAEVIDAWALHQPMQDALNFQQSVLPHEELVKLYEWCTTQHPKMMMLVGADTLTVGLTDADVEEYSWHPPKVESAPDVPKGI